MFLDAMTKSTNKPKLSTKGLDKNLTLDFNKFDMKSPSAMNAFMNGITFSCYIQGLLMNIRQELLFSNKPFRKNW